MNEITMKDIKEALEIVNQPRHILKEIYEWGYVTKNLSGRPLDICLNKEYHKEIKALLINSHNKYAFNNCKLTELFGIPIYSSGLDMEEEE